MQKEAMTKEQRIAKYPSLRFECAYCGKSVTTDSTERLDKRTRFCCAVCERQYWRKVTRHKYRQKEQKHESSYFNG